MNEYPVQKKIEFHSIFDDHQQQNISYFCLYRSGLRATTSSTFILINIRNRVHVYVHVCTVKIRIEINATLDRDLYTYAAFMT